MKTGTWLVLCPSERAIEIPQLATQLTFIGNETPRVDGEALDVEVESKYDGRGSFTVHLSKAPHVVAEAAELADRKGADRADHDRIATFDARYEISFDRKDADAIYDTLLTVASDIARLCGGVAYNQVNGAFLDVR